MGPALPTRKTIPLCRMPVMKAKDRPLTGGLPWSAIREKWNAVFLQNRATNKDPRAGRSARRMFIRNTPL